MQEPRTIFEVVINVSDVRKFPGRKDFDGAHIGS